MLKKYMLKNQVKFPFSLNSDLCVIPKYHVYQKALENIGFHLMYHLPISLTKFRKYLGYSETVRNHRCPSLISSLRHQPIEMR